MSIQGIFGSGQVMRKPGKSPLNQRLAEAIVTVTSKLEDSHKGVLC